MKKKLSNISVIIIFFLVGIGIGGILGVYHGYNLGYRGGVSDGKAQSDTLEIIDCPSNLLK